ncbi:MAG: ABC transporter permease [Acidimicrobiales bacterium]
MTDTTASADTEASDGNDADNGDERLAFRGPIQQLLTRPEIGALLGIAAVWIMFWLVSAPFGTVGGTANYLDVAAILGIMAVPVALLMIGGEFDLSSGSMTGATAIVVLLLSKEIGEFGGAGLNLNVAVPLGLAFALIIGWFNGTVVEKTSLPSFIVTLGTFFILIGGKLSVSKLFTGKVIVEGLDEADGYDFWNNIFGAGWIRNSHVWDGRDWAWTSLLVFGGIALFVGILDLTFERRRTANPAGLSAFLAGTAAGLLGFILLLTTAGSTSDWTFGIVTGVGVLAGVGGWCLWRYDRAAASTGTIDSTVWRLVGGGLGLIAVAVAIAAIMDHTNEDNLDFFSGSTGRTIFFLGIGLMGILAVFAASGRITQGAPVIGAGIMAVPAISFLITMQAARALLFTGFALAGAGALRSAARRTRSTSSSASFAISILTAAAVAGVALFIRSEGESRKIRVELTVAILLVALAMAGMALASFLSAQRTTRAGHAEVGGWGRFALIGAIAAGVVSFIFELADIGPALLDVYSNEGVIFVFVASIAKGAVAGVFVYAAGVLYHLFFTDNEAIGRALIAVALAALAMAMAAKLLFITALESEATQAVTRFRVSVLFYLLFAAVGTWMLARTQFGSWTFAVGGNKDASRSVGVPAARTKTTLFMMVSVAAFVTGMVIAFRLNSVQSNVGDGQEFRYIIVAVVGGSLLTGGYGSAMGAALGALIWGMISQGIGFAGWNTDWRFLVLGFLLLVAVIVNNFVRARAERMA